MKLLGITKGTSSLLQLNIKLSPYSCKKLFPKTSTHTGTSPKFKPPKIKTIGISPYSSLLLIFPIKIDNPKINMLEGTRNKNIGNIKF